jgi:hypothetical protein
MNRPNFVCGSYDVSPEHPSDWEVQNIVEKNSQTTLAGTLVEDILYRKYKYKLDWDAMTCDDYEDLEELVNYSIDNNLPVTFTYGKWDSSRYGVSCRLDLGYRIRRGGSGTTGYYSTVSLIITEVSAQ